ncbi:MAG: hypothetical protein CFH41_00935 [Alphaproteobacteria bacterium MarineAlpha11_Bin1]|nr:MAG: hypothetical protein CFH41_00935 [Alphaproteobacteria bacterium MarineAlpha11_Bin1]
MKNYFTGLITVLFFCTAAPIAANANVSWVEYKAGVIKEALSKGGSALLFYKSSW